MRTVANAEKFCHSVSWIGEKIIVGLESGVLAHNVKNSKEEKIGPRGGVFSVKSVGSCAVAALCDNVIGNEIRISGVQPLSSDESILCCYEQNKKRLSHLAVSDRYIAACDVQAHQVIVFNHQGDRLFSIGSRHLKRLWGVLLCKSHLVVSDYEGNCLYRYILEADAEPVWVCENLPSASGICVDKDGYLYVASNNHHQIYLVSPEGTIFFFHCKIVWIYSHIV